MIFPYMTYARVLRVQCSIPYQKKHIEYKGCVLSPVVNALKPFIHGCIAATTYYIRCSHRWDRFFIWVLSHPLTLVSGQLRYETVLLRSRSCGLKSTNISAYRPFRVGSRLLVRSVMRICEELRGRRYPSHSILGRRVSSIPPLHALRLIQFLASRCALSGMGSYRPPGIAFRRFPRGLGFSQIWSRSSGVNGQRSPLLRRRHLTTQKAPICRMSRS
jgi:hypothetical protein